MFSGIDFSSLHDGDNFAVRRSNSFSGGVPYDPESLISGSEIANLEHLTGDKYARSKRNWPSEAVYLAAVAGQYTTEEILAIAPRVPILPLPPSRSQW